MLKINDTDAFIEDLVYYYRRNFSLREIGEMMRYKIRSRLGPRR
jgi:hypothetical protein